MPFMLDALLLSVPSMLILTLIQRAFFQHAKSGKVSPQDGPSVDQKPYKLPPLKIGASTHMNMGLRKFESLNWLTIDENYMFEHKVRERLLSENKPSVLQCLPGSEAACHEVLSVVTLFLTSRYPNLFKYSGSGSRKVVHNLQTGESFPAVNNPWPLETAARLAMEDFNLLIKDPSNGEYRLQASATLFPAGWRLEDRIGYTLSELHRPVPAWKDKLGSHVDRYFDHLTTKTAMERHTLFVQTTSDLFQNDSLCTSPSNKSRSTGAVAAVASSPAPHSRETLPAATSSSSSSPSISTFPKQQDLLHNDPSAAPILTNPAQSTNLSNPLPPSTCPLSSITIRRERQTFTRLPLSSTILFTVRTFMTPLTDLDDAELGAFIEQARAWGEDMAAYKGREQWWAAVVEYEGVRRREREARGRRDGAEGEGVERGGEGGRDVRE